MIKITLDNTHPIFRHPSARVLVATKILGYRFWQIRGGGEHRRQVCELAEVTEAQVDEFLSVADMQYVQWPCLATPEFLFMVARVMRSSVRPVVESRPRVNREIDDAIEDLYGAEANARIRVKWAEGR